MTRLELPYAHLGELLRAFREDCFGLTADGASLLGTRDSIRALVAALRSHGYAISATRYEKIEAGDYQPEAVVPLIEAFVAALSLTLDESTALRVQLSYDVLRPELGDSLARFCLHEFLLDGISAAQQAPSGHSDG